MKVPIFQVEGASAPSTVSKETKAKNSKESPETENLFYGEGGLTTGKKSDTFSIQTKVGETYFAKTKDGYKKLVPESTEKTEEFTSVAKLLIKKAGIDPMLSIAAISIPGSPMVDAICIHNSEKDIYLFILLKDSLILRDLLIDETISVFCKGKPLEVPSLSLILTTSFEPIVFADDDYWQGYAGDDDYENAQRELRG